MSSNIVSDRVYSLGPRYANFGIPLLDLVLALALLDNLASAAVMRKSRRMQLSGFVFSFMVFGLAGQLHARKWWVGDACTVGIACVNLLGDWMKPDGARASGHVEIGWRNVWESLTTWKRADKQHDE